MSLIQYITQIHLASGALAELPAACARHHIRRPLLVSDAGVQSAGLLERVLQVLSPLPCSVFAQTPSNPNEQAVRLAAAQYLADACDGLIA
ncbi:iron-containing alcohol dehydrogenase, partial [Escherichia coli]|uniref:iron-containing alcohol dehydrogenase n=1 Tax=Escherichia coli TaxID=562 RepID=UPI000DD90913